MLARLFTRLFYAAVFFALGVWAAPSMGGFGGMIDKGIAAGSRGFDILWSWAEDTVSSVASTTSRPDTAGSTPTAVAPPPAPAAPPPPPARTAEPAPVAAAPAAAPQRPAPPPPAAPTPAPTAAAPAPAAPPPADGLALARAANARGDIAGAIRAYDALIAAQPDDAALRGELGNVYWSAGRLQDAARAYHAAALVSIAAGRLDDAARLEGAVRKGDAALADDLARRLAAARRAP